MKKSIQYLIACALLGVTVRSIYVAHSAETKLEKIIERGRDTPMNKEQIKLVEYVVFGESQL